MSKLSFFKILSLCLFSYGAYEAYTFFAPYMNNHVQFVNDYLGTDNAGNVIVYLFFASIMACFGMPRQIISLVGGYSFGMFWGMFFATCGVALGCIMTFLYARFLLQDSIQSRFSKRLAGFEEFFASAPFTMSVVARFLPLGPNVGINIFAGVTKIKLLPFVLGSFVGYIPQNLIFSVLGSGLDINPMQRIFISLGLIVLAVLVIWLVFKKYGEKLNATGILCLPKFVQKWFN